MSLHRLWSNRELDLTRGQPSPMDVMASLECMIEQNAPATGWNWCAAGLFEQLKGIQAWLPLPTAQNSTKQTSYQQKFSDLINICAFICAINATQQSIHYLFFLFSIFIHPCQAVGTLRALLRYEISLNSVN